MNIGEAWYGLRARDDALKADLARAEGQISASANNSVNRFSSAWQSGMGKLRGFMTSQITQIVGAMGAAFAASKIIGWFGDAIGAASDLNEVISKTGQIFGQDMLPELEAWAAGAADAFGQSKRQALEAASTFGIFGKSAGLAGADLVAFSMEMTELASDLASFHNSSPEEAIVAIGAALRGESEPIRRFGVLLDDATLRARALKLGLIETTKDALTPQQRVLAAHAEIMAQTGDAQGDFARTSDQLANTQRALAAEMENVSAEAGAIMLPALLELATFARSTLIPILRDVINAAGGWGDAWSDASEGVARFMDHVTGSFAEIDRVADELGISYMQARDLVKQHIDAMGGDAELAAQRIIAGWRPVSEEQWRMVEEQAAAWEQYQAQISGQVGPTRTNMAAALAPIPEVSKEVLDEAKAVFSAKFGEMIQTVEAVPGGMAVTLSNGKTIVGPSAEELMAPVAAAVERAEADAMAAAANIPGSIAQAFLDNIGEFDSALAQLEAMLNDSSEYLITESERAAAEAMIARARAMDPSSPGFAAVQSQADALEAELQAHNLRIVAEAQSAGQQTPEAMARGMAMTDWLVEQAGAGIVDVTEAQWAEAVRIAQERGYDTPEEFARAMNMARVHVGSAASAMRTAAQTPIDLVPGAASSAGSRTGSSFAAGIRGQWGPVNAAGNSIAGAARAAPEGLANGGYGYRWGSALSWSFRQGMMAHYSSIYQASIALGEAASVGIQLRSPARAGPLSEPADKWGRTLGRMFRAGLVATADEVREASLRVAAAARIDPTAGAVSALVGGRPAGVPYANGLSIGSINITLPPGWTGTAGQVDDLARRLATQIRLRAAGGVNA